MIAHAVPPRPLPRRAALALSAALPLLLAACVAAPPPPPQVFAPLNFSYLPKLKLNVANIDVDVTWTPAPVPNGQHLEVEAPETPVQALRQMVQDRLVPGGDSGQATVTIDDASLTRVGDRLEANFAVHLDIHNADGTQSGYAEARVSRTRTITDYSQPALRAALYELVKATMADMNVEFEYQVRRSLKDWLQTTTPVVPPPPPVEEQSLTPPPNS